MQPIVGPNWGLEEETGSGERREWRKSQETGKREVKGEINEKIKEAEGVMKREER